MSMLKACRRLTLIEDTATEVLVKGDSVVGLRCRSAGVIAGRAVVLTTGTFLRGLMHSGAQQEPGGRFGEPLRDVLLRSLGEGLLREGRATDRFLEALRRETRERHDSQLNHAKTKLLRAIGLVQCRSRSQASFIR